MSGQNLYYPWADIASDAGLVVKVTDTNAGWERRARSSGGFPAPPLGCVWHHAASSNSTSDEACVNYQVRGNPDNPVGNGTLGRNGDFWPVAGGASNCAGKSERDIQFSRGVCPISQGNTYLANWEVNNDGVGGPWSTQLIDAYFKLSNAVNAYLGNQPDDIISHALGDGTGYTNRKIDPARWDAVQGPWVPRGVNSSGTWSLPDMRAECRKRAGSVPGPIPPTPGGDVIPQVIKGDGGDSYYAWDGVVCNGIPGLEWVQWGYEAGLYQNTDPVVYPQGFIDQLREAQGS
jgi:hypothetical protein